MMLSTTVMTLCSSMHIGFVPSSACGSITLRNFTKILQCGYLFSSQLDCKCLSSTLSWYYFFFTLKLQLGESCLMGLVGAMLRICLSWLQTVYTTLSKVCSMVCWWVDLRGENEAANKTLSHSLQYYSSCWWTMKAEYQHLKFLQALWTTTT